MMEPRCPRLICGVYWCTGLVNQRQISYEIIFSCTTDLRRNSSSFRSETVLLLDTLKEANELCGLSLKL